MTPEGRSGLAGMATLLVMIGAVTGQVFLLRAIFGDSGSSDWAAVLYVLIAVVLIGFNVWLFMAIARRIDRLFGNRP